ncbi:MAG TPA: class I SAM-dependent methyltransferase [Actinomycetes bacterium]|nr:class I SAM-dependent methyltransferase [Actinomycetes bacterium]
MTSLEHDLARYYDQDASARAARPIDPERIRRRDGFAHLLKTEERNLLLEVGIGPGTDAAALQAMGLSVTGVDLSAQHATLSRGLGVDALVASVLNLPFMDNTFDAVWSMSTLMHIANDSIETALAEIKRVVVPGAPVALGMWGGDDGEGEYTEDTIEPRRFFSWRSTDRVRALLAAHGRIEVLDTWHAGAKSPHLYQWCILRF